MAISMAATKETLAVAYGAIGNYISLHTATPGTTGASEATGGGYARKATTWTAGASDGVITGSQVTIDAAAGTYTHCGIWKTLSGTASTDFVDGVAISSTTLGATGQILVTPTFTIT